MTKIRSRNNRHAAQPFIGSGVSLYAALGSTLNYRNRRIIRAAIKGTSGETNLGGTIAKTTRVASVSDPATEISYTFPVSWQGEQVAINLRTYADGVENADISGLRVVTLAVDGSLESAIVGTATLLSTQQRDGGVVRIRFRWDQGDGLEPVTFQAIRTAGPTSPSSAETDYLGSGPSQGVHEIDTPALSDAAAYTYKITAVNGSETLDCLTGIAITADATGPIAPVSGSATAW